MTKLNLSDINWLAYKLQELAEHPCLTELDFSDLGNTIGAAIGGANITDEDKELLEIGLRHGYSIADGTHG